MSSPDVTVISGPDGLDLLTAIYQNHHEAEKQTDGRLPVPIRIVHDEGAWTVHFLYVTAPDRRRWGSSSNPDLAAALRNALRIQDAHRQARP